LVCHCLEVSERLGRQLSVRSPIGRVAPRAPDPRAKKKHCPLKKSSPFLDSFLLEAAPLSSKGSPNLCR